MKIPIFLLSLILLSTFAFALQPTGVVTINRPSSGTSTVVYLTGNLTNHNDLSNRQGGDGLNESYHLTYAEWLLRSSRYNVSYAGSLNNASYLTTYNITYHGLINNLSYLSTYNVTYATWLPNYTAFSQYWINWSNVINSSGSGSYNSTYNNLLNQMCASGTVANGTLSNGTLICTTDQTGTGNSSWNQSFANTLYTNQTYVDSVNGWNLSGSNLFPKSSDYNVSIGGTLFNLTTTDAIISLRGFNSLLASSSTPSGGIRIIQSVPEAKDGVWYESYDHASNSIRPSAWIVSHYNSSTNNDTHSHLSLETLDNSTGTPSINSHLEIGYGSNLTRVPIKFPDADVQFISNQKLYFGDNYNSYIVHNASSGGLALNGTTIRLFAPLVMSGTGAGTDISGVNNIISSSGVNIDLETGSASSLRVFPGGQSTFGLTVSNTSTGVQLSVLGSTDLSVNGLDVFTTLGNATFNNTLFVNNDKVRIGNPTSNTGTFNINSSTVAIEVEGGSGGLDIARFKRKASANTEFTITGSGGDSFAILQAAAYNWTIGVDATTDDIRIGNSRASMDSYFFSIQDATGDVGIQTASITNGNALTINGSVNLYNDNDRLEFTNTRRWAILENATGLFHLRQSGTTPMFIPSGNLILNGTSNTELLDVNGNINYGTSTGKLIIYRSGSTNITQDYIAGIPNSNSGTFGLSARQSIVFNIDSDNNAGLNYFGIRTNRADIDINTAGEVFRVTENGSVGIATTTPTQLLDVRGAGNFSSTIYINNGTDVSTLGGGSAYYSKIIDLETNVTTVSNATNGNYNTSFFNISLTQNVNYTVDCEIYTTTDATATAIQFNTTYLGTFSKYYANWVNQDGASSFAISVCNNASSCLISPTASRGTNTVINKFTSRILPSTSDSLMFYFRSETAGQVVVASGSYCKVEEVRSP